MTGLVAVALAVCAVGVVALGGAVIGLRSRVDSLSRRLEELVAPGAVATGASGPPVPAADDDPSLWPEASVPGDNASGPDAPPVALITAMAPGPVVPTEPRAARVVSVTLAGPLIKVAALSHGIQHALREESRMRIGYAMRRELKRQRKLRRRQASGRARARGSARDAVQGGAQ